MSPTSMWMYPKNRRGFTLIELMIVVAIIAVLAGVVAVNFSGTKAKSRDSKRVSDLKLIQLALENYFLQYGKYPCCDTVNSNLQKLVPDFLPTLPKDPSTGSNYLYGVYSSTASSDCAANRPVRYHIGAIMESNQTNNRVFIEDHDWGPSGSTLCSGGGNDFHGRGYQNNSQPCVGTTDSGYDTCYDLTN